LKSPKKARRNASWSNTLVRHVWPQERDFLERPERYRYVRKLLPSEGCVFCTAAEVTAGAKGKLTPESLVLYRDADVMVMMNKYPYNTGHLLILPVAHIGEIWKLSDAVTAQLSYWIKKSVKIVQDEMKCAGFNIGLNHGAVAGAGIPEHLHWHVVPRWAGDTNFFPLIAETKVLPQTLEQTYARLAPHFLPSLKKGRKA